MHISSIPSNYGIGTFGKEAYKFVDFLCDSGQKYWQILPIGHTGYGNSPYQCFSAFAGNPYFIDLDFLIEENLITEDDVRYIYVENERVIDYSQIFNTRFPIYKIAFSNFVKNIQNNKHYDEVLKFYGENKFWLNDYSLFMALKDYYNGDSFTNWDNDIKFREPEAISYFENKLGYDIDFWKFIQYNFFKQWKALKDYANSKGIKIIGDIPIYVSGDSCDVWSTPRLFKLNQNREPITVSGCPPDDFSSTGQLWGNPIYDWSHLELTNYDWWICRIRESLKLFDVVRIDHFRGFESFWEIPYENSTAEFGRWTKGPGIKLFNRIKDTLKNVNIIAEDLGYLTDEVINLRIQTGYPGMKILQFGFSDINGNDHTPHNYSNNSVVYTGTHDNDTIRGWMDVTGSFDEVNRMKKYFGITSDDDLNWKVIRGAWSSVCSIAITTMQDLLDLGNESRMNYPSRIDGNWIWRMGKNDLTNYLTKKLRDFTELYGRCRGND